MAPPVGQTRMLVAGNLRRLRRERGLSQEKLALMAGVHRTFVGIVERGGSNVSVDTIDRFADVLAVEPVVLFTKADGTA